ncbi:hypothetical protein Q7P37_002673 [Cladosporium fusiforme]
MAKKPKPKYSPLRSAVILTLSFLLPLLLSMYSDRLSEITAVFWPRKENVAESNFNGTSVTPIFAQKDNEDASRMLEELRRDNGKWNSNHPRYRLLNALKSYLRYGEEKASDLDTWRKRYKKLPRTQRASLEKTVSYTNKLNTVEDLMIKNGGLAEDIMNYALQYYGIPRAELDSFVRKPRTRPADKVVLRLTL